MDDEIKQETEKLFGRLGWHHYSKFIRKDGKKKCHWCPGPEDKRALVNIWGAVCDVGACNKYHPSHHGKARDSL